MKQDKLFGEIYAIDTANNYYRIEVGLEHRVGRSVVLPTLIEGLSIIGWVFLWEAASLFFFTNRDLHHPYKSYKRLENTPVIFRKAEHD